MSEDAWLPTPGSPWQRLDPRSIAVHPILAIKSAGFPAAAAIAGVASQLGWWALLAVPALVVVGVLFGVLSYASTSYLIADGQVRVRRGLVNRRTLTANLDKVRSVDLEAPLLHRLIGVSRVEIGTGVDNTRIELDALGHRQARELRRALLHPPDAHEPDGAHAPPVSADPATRLPPSGTAAAAEEELARLDPRWARYAPLKLGGLAVIAGGLGALTQVVDDEAWSSLTWADTAWSWLAQQVLTLVVVLGFLLAVLTWIALSVGAYLAHWWRFRLTRTPETIRLTAGLVTTRSTSIERSRIRGLRASRALLVRWAEGGDLASYATGVDQGVTALLPTAPVREVHRVGAALLHDDAPLTTPLREHGPQARARLRWRGGLLTTLVTVAMTVAAVVALRQPATDRPDVGWVLAAAATATAATGLLTWAAVRSAYAHLGHALTPDHLVAGSGIFTATREVLELDGIIGWVTHQSFFQRRRGLADLVATTAAGPEHVVVRDLPLPRAIALAERATPGMLAGFVELADSGETGPLSATTRP